MRQSPVAIDSKLPWVGTTIFTVMSKLAADCGAINLSQGFPDFQAEAALFDATLQAMSAGRNQYPPMAGVAELRTAIADKVAALYGADCDAEDEITVTAGATQAIFTAIAAFVRGGDEVIVFEPVYDSYVPAIETVGGKAVYAALRFPDYRPDWEQVRSLLSPRTRMIIINSPHNPTGTVMTADDLATLAELAERHDLIVVSDEVYEHLVFDGRRHESVLRYPALAARSFAVSSFGKTYHVTGWKTGYCVAPAQLTTELRRVHQFVTFVGITPIQLGLAEFMQAHPAHLRELPAFYQGKRDVFNTAMAASRFRLAPSSGTYFQLADYSAISDEDDRTFAQRVTREHGVASIPLSPFYKDPPEHQHLLRFCFAKEEATLDAAIKKLCRI